MRSDSGRGAARLLTAVVVAALASLPARGAAQLAIAANGPDDVAGAVRAAGTRVPWAPRRRALATDADVVLAPALRGRVAALSRRTGVLTILDRGVGRALRRFQVGADAEDVAVTAPCRAYVSRRHATHLLRLDLCSGARAEVIDLAPFADQDGRPDLGMLLAYEGRLYVQLRRLDDVAGGFASPPYLAVVDLAREALIDVDADTAGVQAIALQGTAPKHRMQVVAATRQLFVSASGGFFDAGGIEVIELDTLRSLGLVIREDDHQTGADLGPFVMVTPERGYLVHSTDFDLSSHLKAFTLRGGVEPGLELHVTLGYAAPTLVVDPPRRHPVLPRRRHLWPPRHLRLRCRQWPSPARRSHPHRWAAERHALPARGGRAVAACTRRVRRGRRRPKDSAKLCGRGAPA